MEWLRELQRPRNQRTVGVVFAVALLCLLSTPYLFLEPLIPTNHTNDWSRRDTYPQQLRLSFGEMETHLDLRYSRQRDG
ncbi:uncharacterized protein ACA1_072120 [Acanthamoeba castellanii str. Neff]|uniref:Uncharacterized protein n=1 Tax=Acanthamoeba castellanii (strain ATCC 30010 / Neff) TaxID=1257118 RepID=L8HEM2_ACACF|nr:uncharacterized protein ACA1_072120 [Acanthamoeba castellanii str. Neff]ELR23590.1 hypothetical protein ACA1_072120 [Acanthamoeba castellanii str. Neff]